MASPRDFDWTDRVPEPRIISCPVCGETFEDHLGPSCTHTEEEWQAALELYDQLEREERYWEETGHQHRLLW